MHGTYTGDVVDGIRHGTGQLVFTNGDVYKGSFSQGFRHGLGVWTCEQGTRIYDGEWKRSQRSGIGKEQWLKTGEMYEGMYFADQFDGKGIWKRRGSVYEGEMKRGRREGKGRMVFMSHQKEETMAVYEGDWLNGRMHGQGKYTRVDGSVYEGSWVDGLAHGYGKEVSSTRLTSMVEVYEGQWKKGMKHGDGTVIRMGKRRSGVWEMGQRMKWTSAEISIVALSSKSMIGNKGKPKPK